MDVGRLQKFEGKITSQGKLLLHGTIFCVECNNAERNTSSMQKPRELQVFLFEQNIIFSDITGKKTQFTNPSYIYKSHIQVCYATTCLRKFLNCSSILLGEQNDVTRHRGYGRQEVPYLLHWPATLRHQLHLHGADSWFAQRVGAHHQSSASKAIRLCQRDQEPDRLHQENGQHQE